MAARMAPAWNAPPGSSALTQKICRPMSAPTGARIRARKTSAAVRLIDPERRGPRRPTPGPPQPTTHRARPAPAPPFRASYRKRDRRSAPPSPDCQARRRGAPPRPAARALGPGRAERDRSRERRRDAEAEDRGERFWARSRPVAPSLALGRAQAGARRHQQNAGRAAADRGFRQRHVRREQADPDDGEQEPIGDVSDDRADRVRARRSSSRRRRRP